MTDEELAYEIRQMVNALNGKILEATKMGIAVTFPKSFGRGESGEIDTTSPGEFKSIVSNHIRSDGLPAPRLERVTVL